MSAFPYKAKQRVESLIKALEPMAKRNPEHQLRGPVLGVFVATVQTTREALPSDPVVAAITEAISPAAVEAGETVNVDEALLLAHQLDAAIGARPVVIA
jgi:hypothetical protein